MPLNVAVQMDPIETINVTGDTTFALMLEAAARGHRLGYFTPDRLSLSEERVVARIDQIEVRDKTGDHFTLRGSRIVDLASVDVVLLRQDPPFDLAYITSTHLLELLPPHVLVVNDPASVRNAPEKLFVTNFPQLMPPTLVTRDKQLIEAFCDEHGEVVMKPLFGHGGAAVLKVSRQDPNFGSLYDLFAAMFREPWVVQRFVPEVARGDKRIILIDGVAVGAVNRVPAEGDIRSNMVRGGAAAATELTEREKEICTTIGPELSRRGLLLVGIDVIDGQLTEINVTSPTGVRAIKSLGGPDLAVTFWDAVEAKRKTGSGLRPVTHGPKSNWILRRMRGLGRRSAHKWSR
jgi:glutathione synthase